LPAAGCRGPLRWRAGRGAEDAGAGLRRGAADRPRRAQPDPRGAGVRDRPAGVPARRQHARPLHRQLRRPDRRGQDRLPFGSCEPAMTSTAAKSRFELNGWHVLAGVVGFFAVIIAVDLVFVIQAVRTYPGEVSVTPYEDGLAYNKRIAQLEAQEQLGWTAGVAAEPGAVLVKLRDEQGRPLTGLTVTGKLKRPATEVGAKSLTF